jgi:hypothetical protein
MRLLIFLLIWVFAMSLMTGRCKVFSENNGYWYTILECHR